jgi:glycosyltransferase involved in cell wall biosynthesis
VVADTVLAVSAHTRAQLRERFPHVEATVVPNGVDHVDRVPAPDRISAQWIDAQHLPPGFILYAGALEARKNVGLVLEACLQLHARGARPTLVLLGQRWFGGGALTERLAAARAQGLDVRALGYQPDAIFYEVMRRAGVLAFPSRDEGFGLPPLEAMRLGVPVVISNAGALGEVCGPAALQVGVDDVEGLAQALQAQRAPSPERTQRIAEGREWTDRYTWASAARATLAQYRGP